MHATHSTLRKREIAAAVGAAQAATGQGFRGVRRSYSGRFTDRALEPASASTFICPSISTTAKQDTA